MYNPFIATRQLAIETSLDLDPKQTLKVSDIINHLRSVESELALNDPIKLDLVNICAHTLSIHADEDIQAEPRLQGIEGGVRTILCPSSRVIKINLHKGKTKGRHNVYKLSAEELKDGFNMKPASWAYGAVTVKIEFNTNISCYASWTRL